MDQPPSSSRRSEPTARRSLLNALACDKPRLCIRGSCCVYGSKPNHKPTSATVFASGGEQSRVGGLVLNSENIEEVHLAVWQIVAEPSVLFLGARPDKDESPSSTRSTCETGGLGIISLAERLRCISSPSRNSRGVRIAEPVGRGPCSPSRRRSETWSSAGRIEGKMSLRSQVSVLGKPQSSVVFRHQRCRAAGLHFRTPYLRS